MAPPLGSADPLTFVAISAGSGFTCGVAKGGQTFCWGRDTYGQLGIGSTDGSDRLRPTPIASSLLFTNVSAGASHACALAKGSVLLCWGRNAFGEVGDGTTNPTSVPVPVYTSITAGMVHGCGVTKASGAYCWGGNYEGQLGTGSYTSSVAPVPVSAPAP